MRVAAFVALGAALLFSGVTESKAQAIKADLLNAACSTDLNASDVISTLCLSFIGAVLDTHAALSIVAPQAKVFCIPPQGLKPEVAAAAFRTWARDNSAELADTRGAIAILSALHLNFPCP